MSQWIDSEIQRIVDVLNKRMEAWWAGPAIIPKSYLQNPDRASFMGLRQASENSATTRRMKSEYLDLLGLYDDDTIEHVGIVEVCGERTVNQNSMMVNIFRRRDSRRLPETIISSSQSDLR